ncbi:MAG: PKD domain-containing protein [bacterium]
MLTWGREIRYPQLDRPDESNIGDRGMKALRSALRGNLTLPTMAIITVFMVSGCGSTDSSTPPIARISASAASVEAGVSIDFDGTGSEAEGGEIVSWAWDFGDGATDSGSTVSHSYSSISDFSVTLVVTDDGGGTGTDSIGITVTPAAVTISGMVQTDKMDGSMSLSWETDTASDCIVRYGPYRFFGLQTAGTGDADGLLHTVTLTGLRPHTSYDVRVSADPVSAGRAEGDQGGWEFDTQAYSRGTNVSAGWEPIGALCFSDADEYYGPYGTGVLIDPNWVLTAAHCFTDDADYFGRVPDASNTVFYVGGNDADHGDSGAVPAEGDLYGIDQIIIHPSYSGSNEYDIALVHLEEPVTDIAPAQWNVTDMSSSAGQTIRTAGFDASLTGLKKRAALEISGIYLTTFITASGLCLGASGIIAVDDPTDPVVLGVSADVAPEGQDPFLGVSIFTRVDAHSTWIADTLAG